LAVVAAGVRPRRGTAVQLFAALPDSDLDAVRFPHPEVLHVFDPRPLLNSAADIAAGYSAGGLLVAETLAAGVAYGRQLWFGTERNVGHVLSRVAADLGIAVRVVG
jgi:hypothetical protein